MTPSLTSYSFLRNLAPAAGEVGHTNCSLTRDVHRRICLLFFPAVIHRGLLFLGALILIDACRRLICASWSKSSSEKNRGVVLVVDFGRPVAYCIGDDSRDLVQRPLSILDKKIA